MKMRARHRTEESPSLTLSGTDAYDERLAGVLVSSRRLEPYRLDAARSAEGEGTLAEKLIRSGTVSDEELARTLAGHYGAEEVDFRHTDPEPDAVALLPQELAQRLRAVPISADDQRVVVAVVDPSPEHVAEVAAALGRPVVGAVTTHRALDRALVTEYKATREVGSHVRAFEARDHLRREAEELESVQVNEDAPVVQVVQMIITQGLRDRASDIHIEPSGDRVRVRYRIDGALTDGLDLPGSIGPAIVSRIKVLADMNIV